MNKLLLALFFLAFCCFISNKAYSMQLFGSNEKVIKIHDLPNTEDYTSSDGKLFDFGYKYTLFNIVFLPVFEQGEGQIVGYIDDENYVLLSDDDIKDLAKNNNIDNLQRLVNIPFWDVWGGKITLGFVIFIFSLLFFLNQKRQNIIKSM